MPAVPLPAKTPVQHDAWDQNNAIHRVRSTWALRSLCANAATGPGPFGQSCFVRVFQLWVSSKHDRWRRSSCAQNRTDMSPLRSCSPTSAADSSAGQTGVPYVHTPVSPDSIPAAQPSPVSSETAPKAPSDSVHPTSAADNSVGQRGVPYVRAPVSPDSIEATQPSPVSAASAPKAPSHSVQPTLLDTPSEASCPGSPPPSLHARAQQSFRLLSHATARTPARPGASIDIDRLSARIWQIQTLSSVPIPYPVARLAAMRNIDSFKNALQHALDLLAFPSPASQSSHWPSPLSSQSDPPTSAMPIIMRWRGELHWHTMDPPVSGSELRSMVQAFLFHEHSPPPVLRLVDEASGVELSNTEDKLECLQELGVIAVGLADAMRTGALADEVPTTDGGNCPFVDLSTPPPPMQTPLPLMMRCAGELHWFTIEPPMSGSELHAMAQAFLFHEHSPPPLLHLKTRIPGLSCPTRRTNWSACRSSGS